MSRLRFFGYFFSLACLLFPASAGATAFETAGTLKPGRVALGLEPILALGPHQLYFFLHGDIGLAANADLGIKFGFGPGTYFGADVELALSLDAGAAPALSALLGVHGASNLGFDLGLNLSKRISNVNLYSSLRTEFEVPEGGGAWRTPAYLDLGVSVPIGRNVDFLLEGGVGLNGDSVNSLSGGLKFYL